jgi:hypothetical protein
MTSEYINLIRTDLFKTKYKKKVSTFMMDYSLLEAYWKDSEELENMDRFCKKYSSYYWNKNKIKKFTKTFASIECVGSSKINRYGRTPSDEIVQVTKFLRDELNIIYNGNNIFSSENRNLTGEQWKQRRDNESDIEYTSFRALMYIIRQIRNNLFHGNKFDLETEQQERNKLLINTSIKTVKFILNHLSKAELEVNS